VVLGYLLGNHLCHLRHFHHHHQVVLNHQGSRQYMHEGGMGLTNIFGTGWMGLGFNLCVARSRCSVPIFLMTDQGQSIAEHDEDNEIDISLISELRYMYQNKGLIYWKVSGIRRSGTRDTEITI
jgi:hypothetical protein